MQDRSLKLLPGAPVFVGVLIALAMLVSAFLAGRSSDSVPTMFAAVAGFAVWVACLFGFVVNGPNHTRVVQLFGTYVGTLSDVGLFWGNPFYSTTRISVRVRTFETGVSETPEVKEPGTGKVLAAATSSRRPSKVNDRDGTPIEIAATIVWKVVAPAQAAFGVDDYEQFVHVQSEAALRTLASRYRYDGAADDEFSLRGHIDEVAEQLKREVQARATVAGIEILEARISYLAYAPEIAAAMLQRQQAGAVVAARSIIVDGAVGMVEHALEQLAQKNLVELPPDRKADLVANLLVVLCSHSAPQPVLNAGSRT